MKFERLHEPLASRAVFMSRLAASLGLAICVIGVSLAAGMWGYHTLEGEKWIDAFADASMILSGMGPLGRLDNDGAKLFAGLYALYSGLLLVATAGLILGPVLHRFLHKLHLDEQDEAAGATRKPARKPVKPRAQNGK